MQVNPDIPALSFFLVRNSAFFVWGHWSEFIKSPSSYFQLPVINSSQVISHALQVVSTLCTHISIQRKASSNTNFLKAKMLKKGYPGTQPNLKGADALDFHPVHWISKQGQGLLNPTICTKTQHRLNPELVCIFRSIHTYVPLLYRISQTDLCSWS